MNSFDSKICLAVAVTFCSMSFLPTTVGGRSNVVLHQHTALACNREDGRGVARWAAQVRFTGGQKRMWFCPDGLTDVNNLHRLWRLDSRYWLSHSSQDLSSRFSDVLDRSPPTS